MLIASFTARYPMRSLVSPAGKSLKVQLQTHSGSRAVARRDSQRRKGSSSASPRANGGVRPPSGASRKHKSDGTRELSTIELYPCRGLAVRFLAYLPEISAWRGGAPQQSMPKSAMNLRLLGRTDIAYPERCLSALLCWSRPGEIQLKGRPPHEYTKILRNLA
jgi:hypothetical protein